VPLRRLILLALAAGLLTVALTGCRDVDPRAEAQVSAPPQTRVIPSRDSWRIAVPGVAREACRLLTPASGADGPRVALDAGHGGRDAGAVSGALVEAELTLDVTRRVADDLRADGFEVVLTRTTEDGLTTRVRRGSEPPLKARQVKRELERRNACVNTSRAEAMVSVHFNSLGDPAASGTETIYNDNRPFSLRSRALAEDVHDAVVDALDSQDRGVITDETRGGPALSREGAEYGQLLQLGPPKRPWFRVPTRVPGVVSESLFVTSASDAAVLGDPAARQELAEALGDGVRRWFAR
jgi:N-acetylmuramoyl-L-alanine amidase